MSSALKEKIVRAKAEAEKAMQYLASCPRFAQTVLNALAYRELIVMTNGWLFAQGKKFSICGRSMGLGLYEVRLEEEG